MSIQSEKARGSSPFAVDPQSEVPVGVQLAWRVRTLILSGRLKPGEALPSVRRLADWAGVNANTAHLVYESLRAEGLISGRQGKGTFVAEGASQQPDLEAIALEALRRGRDSGTSPRDLAIAVMACAEMLEEEAPPAAAEPDSEAEGEDGEIIEVRKELRRQIGQLESELASYVRHLDPEELPTAPPWAEGHVAGVEELEATRDVLVAKLFKAREAAVSEARRESEARAAKRDREGHGPLARAMSWWRQKG
jgi:DNA-binding transcriptional regulator YhcF (GntR family)